MATAGRAIIHRQETPDNTYTLLVFREAIGTGSEELLTSAQTGLTLTQAVNAARDALGAMANPVTERHHIVHMGTRIVPVA